MMSSITCTACLIMTSIQLAQSSMQGQKLAAGRPLSQERAARQEGSGDSGSAFPEARVMQCFGGSFFCAQITNEPQCESSGCEYAVLDEEAEARLSGFNECFGDHYYCEQVTNKDQCDGYDGCTWGIPEPDSADQVCTGYDFYCPQITNMDQCVGSGCMWDSADSEAKLPAPTALRHYDQCGGQGWIAPDFCEGLEDCCDDGFSCAYISNWFSSCQEGSHPPNTIWKYGQCDGAWWPNRPSFCSPGGNCCSPGLDCSYVSPTYSHCTPENNRGSTDRNPGQGGGGSNKGSSSPKKIPKSQKSPKEDDEGLGEMMQIYILAGGDNTMETKKSKKGKSKKGKSMEAVESYYNLGFAEDQAQVYTEVDALDNGGNKGKNKKGKDKKPRKHDKLIANNKPVVANVKSQHGAVSTVLGLAAMAVVAVALFVMTRAQRNSNAMKTAVHNAENAPLVTANAMFEHERTTVV